MKGKQKIAALLAVIFVLLIVLPTEAQAAKQLSIDGIVLHTEKIMLDEPMYWTVDVSGGTEPYYYEFSVSKRPVDRTINFLIPESEQGDYCFEYTFTPTDEDVYYRLKGVVTDEDGRRVESYSEEYLPDSALKKKVREVVAECASGNLSDYEKAFNLYDWLCVNAEYDYTYTWHTPDGVLLYGTGVCDSFARAYMLLLKEAGVECYRVHGTARYNGEGHAWVLVNLDGEWYHMDPTWDEASEHRWYFGLNTALIERDHISEYIYTSSVETDENIPVSTAVKYNYEMNKADGVFSHENELGALIEALPPEQAEFSFYYTGNSIPMAIQRWYNANKDEYHLTEYSIVSANGSVFLFKGKREAQSGDCLVSADGVLIGYKGAGGHVVIPADAGITSIGKGAFKDCSDVKSIVVPGTVKSVSSSAFVNCASLESIVFEEGVETIGSFVVSGCPALTSITLPRNLKKITDGVLFYGISPTVYCYFGTYAMGHAASFGMDYILLDPGYSVRIPFAVADIEAEAFAGDTMIDGVYVEGYVRTIGSRAFAGCVNMIRINLPGSLYFIAPDAFENCPKLVAYCEANSYALDWCRRNGVEYVVE